MNILRKRKYFEIEETDEIETNWVERIKMELQSTGIREYDYDEKNCQRVNKWIQGVLEEVYKRFPVKTYFLWVEIFHDALINISDKIDNKNLQCMSSACLWIATKLEEVNHLSVKDLVQLSDIAFEKTELKSMEQFVLEDGLKFKLGRYSPVDYIAFFQRFYKFNDKYLWLMIYYLDIFSNYAFFMQLSKAKRSILILYLCQKTLHYIPSSNVHVIQNMIDISCDVQEIIQMHGILFNIENNTLLTNIYLKYSKGKYYKVALITCINKDQLF